MGKWSPKSLPGTVGAPSGKSISDEPSLYPKNVGSRKVYTIAADRWDKNLPYYFTVRKADPTNGSVFFTNSTKVAGFNDFKLPINPSNISISIPFAVSVTATTRGVLEEHNGTVFRTIIIEGTTGVTPGNARSGGYSPPASSGFGDSVLRGAIALAANTIAGVQNTIKAFQRTLTAATGELPAIQSGTDNTNKWQFGHAQLHLLLNYFVAYSEFRKKSEEESRLARLLFVSEKDNTAYVVTPISFDVVKSADDPHMWRYRIALRAWDLANDIVPFGGRTRNPFGFQELSNNPNLLARIFNTTREARSTIAAAQGAIRAVASDFENMYKVVGEILLVAKETGGLVKTIKDFDDLIASKWNQISQDFNSKIDSIGKQFGSGKAPASQQQKNVLNSANTLQDTATAARAGADPTNPSGIPLASGSTAERELAQQKLDAQNPFNSSSSLVTHTDFLDTYPLSDFVLSDDEQDRVDSKVRRVMAFSINDYDQMRAKIESVRDAYADSRGLGDTDYDSMAGRTTSASPISRTASSGDYKILKAFNDIIAAIDALSATNELQRKNMPDQFIRAQKAVGDSGIVIGDSNSAFPVPFPYKGTLEKLASLYLSNPDRWIDIALLNRLKPPYIDETGFIRNFTSSGSGNAFTISSATDMFIGQEVFLSSASVREEKRHIVNIEEVGLNSWLITVDGTSDLSKLTTAQLAKMKAYLPNTVNSSKIIFIPLDVALPSNSNSPDTREIPATRDLTIQEKLMGADVALTGDFDIAIGSTGDAMIATGYRNAIQAIQLKLAVEPGQLKKHPEFGAGVPIGERYEMTAQQLKQYLEEAITGDPRFDSLPDIKVQFDGPTVTLYLRVRVIDDGGVIPIKFVL